MHHDLPQLSTMSMADTDILRPTIFADFLDSARSSSEIVMSLTPPVLPYALDALEPHISRRTLAAHFGRHHQGYADKTRALIANTPLAAAGLDEIVRKSAQNNRPLFNAAAQTWNHTFYWSSMHPAGGGEARGPIAPLITESFGSQSAFRQAFVETAANLFGSGWVWLALDGERLVIVATENAGTPLTSTRVPLLTLDVWEHAYYLDYQQRRLDYINAFMTNLVNWDFANLNLVAATERLHTPQTATG
jgi:Fe-Mn family superoxide dismutase